MAADDCGWRFRSPYMRDVFFSGPSSRNNLLIESLYSHRKDLSIAFLSFFGLPLVSDSAIIYRSRRLLGCVFFPYSHMTSSQLISKCVRVVRNAGRGNELNACLNLSRYSF